jgi:hypothetical protein
MISLSYAMLASRQHLGTQHFSRKRIDTMRPQNTELETHRRSEAIAAMGYRLAAAGPRTRQRLIERETAAPAPPETQINEPLPTLASWDDALWEKRLAADEQLGMARLSARQSRFPIWRAAALLASAVCGFSLVLFGQSLHLDQKLRQANHPAKPTLLAETQPAQAQPAPPRASAPALPSNPQPAPPPVQAPGIAQAAPAPEPAPPKIAQPDAATAPASQEKPAPSPPPMIRQAALPSEHPKPHPALMRQLPTHTTTRPVFAVATHPANRAPVPHHDLPHWLTEDRPEHERELIMSPPPHNLEPPAGAELAANTHQAAPKNELPPIPPPAHRPALIYAEAHSAPRPYAYWAAPRPAYNANPYYAPYPQNYGYYGALPPPTPY